MFRYVFIVSALFLGMSAQAGKEQDSALSQLSAGYKEAYESPQSFQKDSTYDKWNKSVLNLSSFVEQNHKNDKLLVASLKEFLDLNKILVNAVTIFGQQGHDLEKFEKVISDSQRAQKALEKETYLVSSKREARQVLVQACKYLQSAAAAAQARVIISSGIQKLITLQDLERLSRAMEQTLQQAKTIGNDPSLRTQFEAQIKSNVTAAQSSLLDIQNAWIAKRKTSLHQLRQKQSHKIENLAGLQDEFLAIEQNLEETNQFLASVPLVQLPTILTLYLLAGNPLEAAEKKMDELNRKMAKARKEITSMQVGMARIDLLLQKEVQDPRFEKASFDAQNSLKVAEQNLKDINALFEQKRIEALSQHSERAATLVSDFETKAKSLKCADLTSIGAGKAGIEKCRKAALGGIFNIAQSAKISICLLTVLSSDPAIDACAKVVQKSY